jgi:hypothetical protein
VHATEEVFLLLLRLPYTFLPSLHSWLLDEPPFGWKMLQEEDNRNPEGWMDPSSTLPHTFALAYQICLRDTQGERDLICEARGCDGASPFRLEGHPHRDLREQYQRLNLLR